VGAKIQRHNNFTFIFLVGKLNMLSSCRDDLYLLKINILIGIKEKNETSWLQADIKLHYLSIGQAKRLSGL